MELGKYQWSTYAHHQLQKTSCTYSDASARPDTPRYALAGSMDWNAHLHVVIVKLSKTFG